MLWITLVNDVPLKDLMSSAEKISTCQRLWESEIPNSEDLSHVLAVLREKKKVNKGW